MQKAFERLKQILKPILYTLPDGSFEEVIHFSNVKFVYRKGVVVCHDKDYWDFQESRIISNPKYLSRMEDIIMKLPEESIALRSIKRKRKHGYKEYIYHPNYFKSAIKGICKFGENLHLSLSENDKQKIKRELKRSTPKTIAMKYNLSESFCKHLMYEK